MYFCISEWRRGPQNVAGPEVAYPLLHPLDGPECKQFDNEHILNLFLLNISQQLSVYCTPFYDTPAASTRECLAYSVSKKLKAHSEC